MADILGAAVRKNKEMLLDMLKSWEQKFKGDEVKALFKEKGYNTDVPLKHIKKLYDELENSNWKQLL